MNILNPSGRAPVVGDVSEFDCRVVEGGWPWALANSDKIAVHWREASATRPGMFDGQVLIASEVGIEKSRLVSTHIEVQYAALKYWQDMKFPRADAFNLFGAGIVVTSDGAVLMGEMGAHTANAGMIYFPCGTPDRDDVVEGRLDIEGSIVRELQEETGLDASRLIPTDERWISWDGPLFCCARRFETTLSAAEVEEIAAAHFARQDTPELERVLLVRRLDEIEGLPVPAYAAALLGQVLV